MERKLGDWAGILVEAFKKVGGEAHWDDIYPIAKIIRAENGHILTPEYKASIRDCIQRHSSDSKSKKRLNNQNAPDLFYKVSGAKDGIWGLRHTSPMTIQQSSIDDEDDLYIWGMEGILKEQMYLRRVRDQSIVQNRKIIDNFTCQVCSYRQRLPDGNYVIDVHHLFPLKHTQGAVITSTEDLVCLCPNCHRMAHSRPDYPLSLEDIRYLLQRSNDGMP